MNGRFNCIIEYLNKKKSEQFTGSTKLSIESGVLVAINESNEIDIPLNNLEYDNRVMELVKMTDDPIYNGAVVFTFEKGIVNKYAFSKTYKGETLKRFLGN